jgi:cytochrome c oxidase assembly factor CtaG
MSPAVQAIFADWEVPWIVTILTVLTMVLYLRGWFAIRKTRPQEFTSMELGYFASGMLVLWLAIGSPIDGFADVLLSAHMVQHLLLMSFVPPLVLLGKPTVPLLRGLPRWFRRGITNPLIRLRPVRSFAHWLISPVVAWLLFNVTFLGWHMPAAYDFALRNENWHDFEHICFLFSSILFWWPIIAPWPTQSVRNRWLLLPYLMTADFVNTALSAFLAFCNRPLYSYYLTDPNPFHVAPLQDQILGAAIMWVIGSIVFLVPFMWITVRILQPKRLATVKRAYI